MRVTHSRARSLDGRHRIAKASIRDSAPATPKGRRRGPSVPGGSGNCSEALGERVAPRQPSVGAWDLPTPRASELLSKHVRVGLRRPRRDTETVSDFLVRAAGGDQLDHLALPIGDDRRALMQNSDHDPTLTLASPPAYWPDGVFLRLRLPEYSIKLDSCPGSSPRRATMSSGLQATRIPCPIASSRSGSTSSPTSVLPCSAWPSTDLGSQNGVRHRFWSTGLCVKSGTSSPQVSRAAESAALPGVTPRPPSSFAEGI
jgi:hypothetical protein